MGGALICSPVDEVVVPALLADEVSCDAAVPVVGGLT